MIRIRILIRLLRILILRFTLLIILLLLFFLVPIRYLIKLF